MGCTPTKDESCKHYSNPHSENKPNSEISQPSSKNSPAKSNGKNVVVSEKIEKSFSANVASSDFAKAGKIPSRDSKTTTKYAFSFYKFMTNCRCLSIFSYYNKT